MKLCETKQNIRGFTLIELLVVIAVIGLISTIVIVSMQGTRGKARIAVGLQFSQSVNHALGAHAAGIWNFDEGSGTTAYDYSGCGNHGSILNGATYVADTPFHVLGKGQGKWALRFDGVDDYVRVPANLQFQTIHGPSTLELWFKANSLSGAKRIFSDNCFEWGIYHSGSTVYGAAYSSVNGGNVSIGQWYHAALVHKHPTGLTNTKIEFYINGNLKGITTLTITTHNGYTDSPYYIGDDNCSVGYEFNGLIDEVRIYEQALSAAEIQKHYTEGAARYGLVLK